MQVFNLEQLAADVRAGDKPYLEFLRVPSLSMGVYHLRAGQSDLQQPHTEDEVYYVLKGKARFVSAGESLDVKPGAVIFVEKLRSHRFCDIVEDLSVLVLFAPAEGASKSCSQ